MIRKTLRRVLGRNLFGNLLRLINYITLPKQIERVKDEQATIDLKTEGLSLYDFATCPFCIKVRRFMHENNINIEILDADNNKTHKSDLVTHGGKHQVPCLRITEPEKEDKWLYESDDIIAYLKKIIA
ncbi:MAG: glutathione S-transferase N-terminal domain-containing protein [Pseudomonadota bacterium]|nr:glutathione S-transferase N-terminal domain-containing protein [Pseudomonadota bacterium]